MQTTYPLTHARDEEEQYLKTENGNKPYSQIFDLPENGIPNEITKRGCLALMRLGVVAWNAWRSDFPTRGGRSYFGFFNQTAYENSIDFSNCVFEEEVNFAGFNFGSNANFENAQFKKIVIFESANFVENTNFDLAKFQNGVVFQKARFESDVRFRCAKFDELAIFSLAQFGGITDFTAACFSGQANFDKVIHGRELIFNNASFDCPPISFVATSWESFLFFYELDEREHIKKWAEKLNLSPGKINSALFGGTKFTGTVDFSGVEFAGKTRFSKSFANQSIYWFKKDENGKIVFDGGKVCEIASFRTKAGDPLVFGSPPIFHNCKFNQDVSFDGAEFPAPTGHESSSRAYRTLKLAFAQIQGVREEQRFFRLEMAEEHYSIRGPARWMHSMYALLSDYGFSVMRPSLLLLVTSVIALILYGFFAGYEICIPFLSSCTPSREWFEFGLINAFPLLGMDQYAGLIRKDLFPSTLHPGVKTLITITVIVQKSISLIAFFLIGLALRNLFKMK